MNAPDSSDRAPFGEPDTWERTVIRDILLGQKLGEYRVLRRIGAGGMGVVYEGEQPLIGRRVAIKILRPDGGEQKGLLEEARASNAVPHRGIVDVYGFGELPGIGQYLVMEFLEGKPLDEVLRERGALTPAEVVPLLDELLGALEAAHSRGVVHRDLKPSNIFLVEEPGGGRYVKVLDFGLAKRMEADTGSKQSRASMVVGTPHYMAPEQAQGASVGPAVDLYAAGIIAYELLAGDVPFDGAQPLEIALKQVQDIPPPLGDRVNIPTELHDLVHALLEKAPEARPNIAVARRDLKRIARLLREEETQIGRAAPAPPPQAAPVTRPAPSSPPSSGAEAPPTLTFKSIEHNAPGRARWVWVGSAAFALLLLLAGGAYATLGGSTEEAPGESQPVPPAPVAATTTPERPPSPPLEVPAPKVPEQLPDVMPEPLHPAAGDPKVERAPDPTPPPRSAQTRREVHARRRVASEKGILKVGVIAPVRGDVYLNGKKVGVAPLKRSLAPGSYSLRIEMANGVRYRQRIRISPGKELLIQKKFDARTRTLVDLSI